MSPISAYTNTKVRISTDSAGDHHYCSVTALFPAALSLPRPWNNPQYTGPRAATLTGRYWSDWDSMLMRCEQPPELIAKIEAMKAEQESA